MLADPLIIQPGSLRHSITIEQATSTRDAAGQPIASWNTILSTRARIESTQTATYKFIIANNADSSQASHIITIRWPGANISITPDMRVRCGDQVYLISALDNALNRNRVVRIFCYAVDAGSN